MLIIIDAIECSLFENMMVEIQVTLRYKMIIDGDIAARLTQTSRMLRFLVFPLSPFTLDLFI